MHFVKMRDFFNKVSIKKTKKGKYNQQNINAGGVRRGGRAGSKRREGREKGRRGRGEGKPSGMQNFFCSEYDIKVFEMQKCFIPSLYF